MTPLKNGLATLVDHHALRTFERQVLLFPLLVVLLTSIVFILGGHITAWLWWLPVLGTLGLPFLNRSIPTRTRIQATAYFLLLLIGVWIFAGLCVTVGWMDTLCYHLPAIRLMIDGWNPIWCGTEEAIATTMNIDPWHMRLWHVLSMSKTTWIFSTVAYQFTNTPFNLLFPLFPFLFITACAQVLRFAKPYPLLAKGLLLFLLWSITPASTFSIADSATFLGAVGVLCTMGVYFREGRMQWTSVIVHSFWLMTAKPTGLLTCFLFWVLFSFIYLWQHRTILKHAITHLSLTAGALTLLLLITCASPYITSWVNFGHPLYPKYTADPTNFPVIDFTGDFNIRNEDAARMGALGYFVNAYVSTTLTHAYYMWRDDLDTFTPRQQTWSQGGENGKESDSPTTTRYRITHVLCFLIVLLLGRKPEKLLATFILLGIFAVPTTTMIGYTRYVPWVSLIQLLAVCSLASIRLKHLRRLSLLVITLALLPSVAKTGLGFLATIDQCYASYTTLKHPPQTLYAYYSGGLSQSEAETLDRIDFSLSREKRFYLSVNNLLLLREDVPELQNIPIQVLELYGEERDAYLTFPPADFKMPPTYDMTGASLFNDNALLPDRKERLLNYPTIACKILFIRLPELLWQRIH